MQVPEFRVAYSIKTDALDALYRRLKPKGVTMSGLLVKAAAAALAKFPDLYAGKHMYCGTSTTLSLHSSPHHALLCKLLHWTNMAESACPGRAIAALSTQRNCNAPACSLCLVQSCAWCGPF